MDTRPQDAEDQAAAAEDEAGGSAAAAAAFAGAETERLRMQVEADKTAQAKAAAEAEAERLRMQVEADKTAQAKAAAEAETERLRMQVEADKTAQAKAAAEAETERLAGSLRPLHCRIGHDLERRDRPGWRERLEAQLELALRERDLATDLRVLCGDLDGPVKHFVMSEERRIVSFLLSSTFTDTEWERNLIIADVVPYLQDLARRLGFEFRLAEMRWGIREAASSAHQTSEICMAELERCQRESQGFSYVFLG